MNSTLPGWERLQTDFAPTDVRTGERMRRIPPDLGAARRAAVLIPVTTDRASLVYTVRRDHLNDHAGQISFPGGSVERSDVSLRHTALREAHEEVSISPQSVEVLGRLEDMYIPPSNFLVTPYVGLLAPGAEFTLAPEEVEEVFAIPLEVLMAPETLQNRRWERDGRLFDVPVFSVRSNHREHDIWGATAAMTATLLARLGWHPALQNP